MASIVLKIELEKKLTTLFFIRKLSFSNSDLEKNYLKKKLRKCKKLKFQTRNNCNIEPDNYRLKIFGQIQTQKP